MRRFEGTFTRQEPIPEAGIVAAAEVMREGRLHRYGPEARHAAALERAYAEWQGARHCLALASGGQAMQIALRALGVGPGDRVLTNAWTLAPVPGAIACVGAEPVLVETTDALVIDLADLAEKARGSGARVLLLSHMRGHLADMDALSAWAAEAGVAVVEDCAHSMGARWAGRRSGGHGRAACFSTQSYKHMDSGEGGLLTTDDPEIAARATILSGSYMMWHRHGAGPAPDAFEDARLDCPNGSARMDELRAAILLPQIALLEDRVARWAERHHAVARELAGAPGVTLPRAHPEAERVGSSIQFRLPGLSAQGCRDLVAAAAERGVDLKWFGAREPHGFTSAHGSWRYAPPQRLPRTDAVLATLFDMRLPLTFSLADCETVGSIVAECAARAGAPA